MALTPFAYTLASTSLRNQKAGFELQFNLLQNSLIRRFNEKVEKVSETPITVRNKIEDLSARQQKLLEERGFVHDAEPKHRFDGVLPGAPSLDDAGARDNRAPVRREGHPGDFRIDRL